MSFYCTNKNFEWLIENYVTTKSLIHNRRKRNRKIFNDYNTLTRNTNAHLFKCPRGDLLGNPEHPPGTRIWKIRNDNRWSTLLLNLYWIYTLKRDELCVCTLESSNHKKQKHILKITTGDGTYDHSDNDKWNINHPSTATEMHQQMNVSDLEIRMKSAKRTCGRTNWTWVP